MNQPENQRLRGLVTLLGDAIEHGSAAVEEIHLATARRPFAIVAAIPPLREPAHVVQGLHELALTGVYRAVRLVSRLLGGALAVALARSTSARRELLEDGQELSRGS